MQSASPSCVKVAECGIDAGVDDNTAKAIGLSYLSNIVELSIKESEFIAALLERIVAARIKHPHNKNRLAALVEEVGEVARDICDGNPKFRDECIDVAVCALRLACEGEHHLKFTREE